MTTKIDHNTQACEIHDHVQALIQSTMKDCELQRRQDKRYPFPQLLWITPVDPVSLLPIEEPVSVVCRDLSFGGLSFYHQSPIGFQLAVIGLETQEIERLDVLLDLKWCRFTQHRWYESGGQFVQTFDLKECDRSA